jgi:hypothetical protein
MRCIYCPEDKEAPFFQKAEHVLPQSFGKFEQNFTLRDMVCDDCNQYFGDNLENVLARDTFEGISRVYLGVKDPEEFKTFGKNSRLIIKIDEGESRGAYAFREYSPEQGKVMLKPVPQIGFLIGDQYHFFLLNDIPSPQELSQKGFDSGRPNPIKVVQEHVELAQVALKAKGFNFKFSETDHSVPSREAELFCKLDITVDSLVFRAVAKIAFNYLAYWEKENYVLQKDFNVIRRFVRYGERAGYSLAMIKDEAILKDEQGADKRRSGHIITVNFTPDKKSVVAQVSLFNLVTYCVSLARDYTGETREIKRGHFFCPFNKLILALGDRPPDQS